MWILFLKYHFLVTGLQPFRPPPPLHSCSGKYGNFFLTKLMDAVNGFRSDALNELSSSDTSAKGRLIEEEYLTS